MNIHVIINIHLHSDDFNRVVLSEIPDVEHSHYINASYVDVSTFVINNCDVIIMVVHYIEGLWEK